MKRILIFLLLLLLVVANMVLFEKKSIEPFSTRNALCLIIKDPNKMWAKFLETLTDHYDVYVMIDNNEIDPLEYKTNYPKIRFLQIPDRECIDSGFIHVNTLIFPKTPIAWDKALYYFCVKNKEYPHVWFIEEDVYIPSKENIIEIDSKYTKADLIYTKPGYNDTGSFGGWNWWKEASHHFDLPWLGGLMCICRMSMPLLGKIREFAEDRKRLIFLEILFVTLAHRNGYEKMNIEEFVNVDCCEKWDFNTIDASKICHPVKNMDDHEKLRSRFNKRF